jgi:hypothetical protein
MKQADHSHHEEPSIRTSSENVRSSKSFDDQLIKVGINRETQLSELRRKKSIKIFLGAMFFALIIVVYVLANKGGINPDAKAPAIPISTDKIVEVEVVDGAGDLKVAQHMINVLRTLGYDVVESKKSNEGIIERSYVLDRSGDLEVAYKLAASLGIPKDKVFQKIDHDLYLDITVVVGKDFSKFKAFQSFNKRNKR